MIREGVSAKKHERGIDMRRTVIFAATGALACAALAFGGEGRNLRAIGEGRALYLTHCASCHDADATGVPELGAPDLTRIEERDGSFRPVHVRVHIEGKQYGKSTKGMPCWQQRLDAEHSLGRAYTFLEIYKLVKYLDFVQGGVPTVASLAKPSPEP